jgi:protein TonB
MKTFFLILIISAFSNIARAQLNEPVSTSNQDPIFTTNIDTPPEFNGGMDQFYIRMAHIPYTWSDRASHRQGHVAVVMIVEKDGSLSNLKVIHGFSEKQNDEILRVVRRLNKWTPGTLNGKPVRVRCSIPIDFKLTDPY